METREKQAYMLMAHQCNEMFWTLLRMLDAPWNDIFIHMDSKNENYQPETVERYVKYAKVFHAQRTSAVWGGITLVKAEFVLLKAAVDHGPYQHYHLISGADLPIQPPEDIRAFFEANPDKEFVHFDPHPFSPFNDERVYYRHFFQNIDLRRHPVLGVINGILLSGQKLLRIKRNQDVHFTKGVKGGAFHQGASFLRNCARSSLALRIRYLTKGRPMPRILAISRCLRSWRKKSTAAG